jgi:hypothetical protein
MLHLRKPFLSGNRKQVKIMWSTVRGNSNCNPFTISCIYTYLSSNMVNASQYQFLKTLFYHHIILPTQCKDLNCFTCTMKYLQIWMRLRHNLQCVMNITCNRNKLCSILFWPFCVRSQYGSQYVSLISYIHIMLSTIKNPLSIFHLCLPDPERINSKWLNYIL